MIITATLCNVVGQRTIKVHELTCS